MLEEILDAYSDLLEIERKSEIALKDLEKTQARRTSRHIPHCVRDLKERAGTYTKRNTRPPCANSGSAKRI